MALFQNSVLNKYLNGLDGKKVSEAWKIFSGHFHNPEVQENIRNSKEEEYQEGFLDDLFVKVLGYTKNPTPNFNLRTEQKNETDSKKADGALLDGEKVKAVIELKGTETTDLGKVEPQAFGYKNKQSDAVYVIISNFEKLRFYIDNAVDFIEFNLFRLDEEEFKLLWLCLAHDSFAKNLPKKVKEASLSEEESITKKLYKDYSAFKHDIFENIVAHNPEFDKLLLFRKTQKLLDRFLFVFFAEDRSLLPPNSIREIITQWMDLRDKYDEYVPLYERFKKYFGYMNEGHKGKKHDIFAYNGGLFAPDEILDTIKIDDDILYKHSLQLSNYDFESEVDVNILGHIFEHSLNEIEEITAELKGEEVDTSKTKRKKDGVFYTPKYITKYIVENTVGKLCDERKAELNIIDERFIEAGRRTKKGIEDLKAYRDWLLNLTICDPACGSGAFLNQALEFLIAEHKYLDELTAKYHNSPLVLSDIENSILENNLFGVDINDEAVEIAKLSLWLRTAQRGRKLTTLNNRIKCGNSLIDDPEIAGDKAFNWQQEFPEIFTQKEKQAFHVTWVTHNARTSQRMIEYKVKKGETIWLDEELEMVVARTLANSISEDKLNVMAFNICGDHVHMLLVCELEELPNIVRKLKGKSAQKTKEYLKVPKEETFHLWAQKFNRKPIEDDDGLANVHSYITNNRIKHNLFINKELQLLVSEVCVDYETAFAPEYSGGFDVVIGNPPYVRAELLSVYMGYFETNYKVHHPASDLFAYFYELGTRIMSVDGLMGYISNTFDKTKAGAVLRNYLVNNTRFKNYVDFTEVQVFDGATTYPIILILDQKNSMSLPFLYIKIPKERKGKVLQIELESRVEVLQDSLEDGSWAFLNKDKTILLDRLKTLPTLRDLYGKCYYGVKTALNEAFIVHENWSVSSHIRYLYEGKEIKKWHTPSPVRKLVLFENGWTKKTYGESISEAFALEKVRNDFPVILDYLLPFEEKAKKRYDQGDFWWELRNCAYYDLFEAPKIIFPNLQNSNKFCLDERGVYINAPAVFLPSSSKTLLCILNSTIVWEFLLSICVVRSGGYIEVKPQYFEQIPIPEFRNETLFEQKADQIIQWSSELIKCQLSIQSLIQSKFDIDKLTRKLENWHELSFKEFLSELKKKKVQLTLSEEVEWMDYFKQEKEKAQALQAQINQTDQEIDKMVYALYGLTEEEIAIVEDNI